MTTMVNCKCARCGGEFVFEQRTNKVTYCAPCKEIRAQITNQRYMRKRNRQKRALLVARLKPHPAFPDRRLWLDETTTNIYRKDGPRKFVLVGSNGALNVRKTKQGAKASQRRDPSVRVSQQSR